MIKDMTSGSPLKLLLWFSLPVVISNLFQQMYMITDLIVVGRYLGIHSLAAIGTMIPLFAVMVMMSFGYTSGLSIIIAQRFGAKDFDGVKHSFAAGILLCFAFSFLIMGLIIPLLDIILKGMNVPPEIMPQAERFIKTLVYGLVAMVFYNYLSNVLRSLGDSKTPLYFLIFSTVFNIVLNVFFIVHLNMGVVGSALGSVCAQFTSVILCLGYILWKFPILRIYKNNFKMTFDWIYDHIRLALPMTVQFSVIGLGGIIIQSVCNSFGPFAIAAMAAGLRIEQLATLPLYSLGAGLVTFSAQNFGAKKIRRIRQSVFQSSVFSLITSLMIAMVVYFYGDYAVALFLEEPNAAVIDMAHTYLKITTLFYAFLGQIFIFRQTLQGMGHSILPMMSGFTELFMRAFAAVILASSFGYVGICYASPIAWVGAVLVVAPGYLWVIHRYKKQTKLPNVWWPKSLFIHEKKG